MAIHPDMITFFFRAKANLSTDWYTESILFITLSDRNDNFLDLPSRFNLSSATTGIFIKDIIKRLFLRNPDVPSSFIFKPESIGIRVRELSREKRCENETVRARSRNTAPERPDKKTIGKNTIIEHISEAVTGAATSIVPLIAA